MNNYLNSFKLRSHEAAEGADPRHIELAALIEFSKALNSSLDLLGALNNLLLVPMGRMLISKGAILLLTESGTLKIEIAKGIKQLSTGDEVFIKSIPGALTIVDDSTDAFFRKHQLGLLIPLQNRDETIGLIALGNKLNGQLFSENELHFLSSLGNIAAPAIANARTFAELQQVNRTLDQKVQVLNTLFEIGQEFNRSINLDEILQKLSLSLMGQMMINRFFVVLKNPENGQLETVYRKSVSFPETVINNCVKAVEKIPVFTTPLSIDRQVPVLQQAGVSLIVPMVLQQETRGYIFLGPKMNTQDITEADKDFLNLLADTSISAIENARLFEEMLEKQRMVEELNMARDIQKRLLPSSMPIVPGYDIHGLNIPSRHVGGDYFDIIPIGHDELLFTIADVSGKGMPASLLMSNLQAGLRMLSYGDISLAKITGRLNNLIFQNTSIEKYITFFIARLNLRTNTLEFVNAGHNPPYLFHADGSHETLEKGGIILGMMADMPFETGLLDFPKGACLSMFTDGVTEAMNGNDPFDEFRVIEFFENLPTGQTCKMINEKMIERLFAYAGDPTKDDDITMLTIKRMKTE